MDDRIDEIIGKMLVHEPVDEAECEQLQCWQEESAEHRRAFEMFMDFYEKADSIRLSGGLDHERAYQKICQASHMELPLVSKRRQIWKFAGMVAAVVLLMGIALMVLWKPLDVSDRTYTADFVGQSGKVQLKLEGGQCIDLVAGKNLVVQSETGQIAVCDSNTLDYQSAGKVNENTRIEYNTLIVPAGAEYNLVLSDGTRVYLNAASELSYPTVFTGNLREVALKGEAYFEVNRDTARQFIVRAGSVDIQVLGTSFNVNAYQDADKIAATLITGKIRALSDGKVYELTPGEQFRKNLLNGQVEIEKVNTEIYTCWKDGYYYFQDCPLGDIMQMLQRWYDIEVFFVNSSLKEMEFTGRLRRYEDIDELFRKFERTRNISFSRKENAVMISTK